MTFGSAGLPVFHFDVRLRFGYYFTVAVWDSRRLVRIASKAESDPKKEKLFGASAYHGKGSRRVITSHLCVASLDADTIAHEIFHAVCEYGRRVRKRYRSPAAREEAMAHEMGSSLVAIHSQIRKELRLHGYTEIR